MPASSEYYLEKLYHGAIKTYLGGQTATPGGVSVQAAITPGATIFWIDAEGGAIYYQINGASASANSHGYVPEDGHMVEGPLDNLTSLHIFGGAGAIAHIRYYR